MGTATTLMILPTDGVLAYYPVEEVTGRVTWALPDGSTPAGAAELRLYWFTTGKGRRDLKVVQTVRFEGPRAWDERPFAVTLPASPYSFRGELITLTWGLELVVGDHCAQIHLVMSPSAEEVVLVK